MTKNQRTPPFLFTGKALDFISCMLTLLIFTSLICQAFFLYINEYKFVIVGLGIMAIIFIILIALIVSYIYFGLRGLPFKFLKRRTVVFPPTRLKFIDVWISGMLLVLNFFVIVQCLILYQKNNLDLISLMQLITALMAFFIGTAGLLLLYKEHKVWLSQSTLE